ncbi:CHASE3 domain-containing protein [Pyxidicoccus caerfyrddinensis]|uniref:CHASE3 domain-containing protein n=1 Tax=Pyxidicoccus caerfyrddinensis TaxID=2709663 RepID=UPI001F08237D|nr:CHASE3 domain-containing protein [Pyxidicoccus caerfyrddinensis]
MSPATQEAAASRASRFGPPLPPATFAGFVVAALAVLLIAVLSYNSLQTNAETGALVRHTLEVAERLEALLSTLKDAETGQRGYLLTGEDSYLGPYADASRGLEEHFTRLRALLDDNPNQVQRLGELKALVTDKMTELRRTIDLRQGGQTEAALTVVRTDQGMVLMNRIRALIQQMQGEERRLLETRSGDFQRSATMSLAVTWLGSALLLVLITISGYMTSRDFRARSLHAWLQQGQTLLSLRMQGDQRLEQLGDNVLRFLTEYLDAQVGAIYLVDGAQRFRRFAGYALPAAFLQQQAAPRPGEGLVGQALQ